MLTQDGMHIIEPFMNTKRKIELSRSELKKVLEALGPRSPSGLVCAEFARSDSGFISWFARRIVKRR